VNRCPGAGPRRLGDRSQILDYLLVQFGAGQYRQKILCPLSHAGGTPVAASVALAHVPSHQQPQVSRQHHVVPPKPLGRAPVPLSIGQHLPEPPAPGNLATARGSFRGGVRGDLESAQYRLAVLAAQPPSLLDVGAQFHRGVPAIQSPSHEQVVHLLPRFGQRGDDPLQPVPQRCQPRRGPSHSRGIRRVGSDAGLQQSPVDAIETDKRSGCEVAVVGEADQPVPQAVRVRQLRRISHRQIGDEEKVAGGGERGVGIGPLPRGAAGQHRIAMLADHGVEQRRAVASGDSLPEAPDQRGIGLSPVVPCYETPLHSRPAGSAASRTPQQASTHDYKRQAPPSGNFRTIKHLAVREPLTAITGSAPCRPERRVLTALRTRLRQ
jgi:hypothetical protein